VPAGAPKAPGSGSYPGYASGSHEFVAVEAGTLELGVGSQSITLEPSESTVCTLAGAAGLRGEAIDGSSSPIVEWFSVDLGALPPGRYLVMRPAVSRRT